MPIVGKTAAGKPIDISAFTDEGFPFPVPLLKGKPENYYIVKIEGTSITEANIYDGDYILIKRAEAPINGKIMLVRYENSSTLKRIKIERKKGVELVYLHWEDGSGDFKIVDSSEYEIQGEFYRNLGKLKREVIHMTLNPEEQRKQAFELFIRALAVAPEAFIKPLTGQEYGKHAVDGAKEIEAYFFPTQQQEKSNYFLPPFKTPMCSHSAFIWRALTLLAIYAINTLSIEHGFWRIHAF